MAVDGIDTVKPSRKAEGIPLVSTINISRFSPSVEN